VAGLQFDWSSVGCSERTLGMIDRITKETNS